MYDLSVELDDRPGALGLLGETLGAAGVSVEGGGMFVVDGRAVAHFLVHGAPAARTARTALDAAGIRVTACRPVLARHLDQQRPGELGALTRALGEAGVNIEVLYSDHDHRLVLVTDDPERAAAATAAWAVPRREVPGAEPPGGSAP